MITARVLLCYFVGDAATIGSPSRYMRLQEFVESSMPQPLNWRLCANCQQATWCGTGVDPDMKLKAAQDSDRSMCTSVSAVQSHLPLEPCSSLSYRQTYHTDDGKQVFVQPTKTSRPRGEHEAAGMGGYSQQATKKLHHHCNFRKAWPMQCHLLAPRPNKKIAAAYALTFADSEWGKNAWEAFSPSLQQVTDAVNLTTRLVKFMQSKDNGGQSTWGFPNLRGTDIGNLQPRFCSTWQFFEASCRSLPCEIIPVAAVVRGTE